MLVIRCGVVLFCSVLNGVECLLLCWFSSMM